MPSWKYNLCAAMFLVSGAMMPLAHGQSKLTFRHFSSQDGLPNQTVYHSRQDEEGYIWFGTASGACRFDGREFEVFSTSDGLTGNDVLEIGLDGMGRVWFFPFRNNPCYRQGDSIVEVKDIEGLADMIIFDSFLDSRGALWFAAKTDEGTSMTYIYLPGKPLKLLKRSSQSRNPRERWATFSFRIFEESTGEIHFSQIAGALRISRGRLEFEPWKHDPGTNYSAAGDFSKSRNLELADRSFLCNSAGGIYREWPGTERDAEFWLPTELPLTQVLLEPDSTLWYGTTNYLLRIKVENGLPAKVDTHLVGQKVSSLMRDREGNLWVTTTNDGIFLLSETARRLRRAVNGHEKEWPKKLALDGQGKVWVGFDGGSLHMGTCPALLRPSGFDGEIRANRIRDLVSSGGNAIWVVSEGRRPVVRIENGKMTPMQLPIGALKSGFLDAEGAFYLGTSECTYKISRDWVSAYIKGRATWWPDPRSPDLERRKSLVKEFTRQHKVLDFASYSITSSTDKRGGENLWMGTTAGLYRKSGEEITFLGEEFPALAASINDLQAGPGGAVWVATSGQGIGHFDGEKFTSLGKADGLISDNCTAICVAGDSVVWVGTPFGLSRVPWDGQEFDAGRISHLTTWEGLPANQIDDILMVGDTVLVATAKGLTWFPDRPPASLPPKVQITRLLINEKETAIRDTLVLAHDQNHLRIDFAGLFFKNPAWVHFRYKMEGADLEWITTERGSAVYPNLRPGNYVFEVFALNDVGKPSEKAGRLCFEIQPAFYQTIWFYCLLGLVLVLVTTGIALGRIRTIRRTNALERQMLESRQTALQSQMNPHFIFNSLNSIQLAINEGDVDGANIYLAKFGRLIRTVLDFSRTDLIALDTEVEFLREYLEMSAFRFRDHFTYRIQVEPGLDDWEIPPLIIQPFLENAILHGLVPLKNAGVLTIDFQRQNQLLTCTITDNGVGREAALRARAQTNSGHQSMGLKNVRDRIDLINQEWDTRMHFEIEDLEPDSQGQTGTRVRISFPDFSA